MPPLSNAKCGGTFDRNNPLFERQRVPCQFQSDVDGVGGGNAMSRNSQRTQATIIHYTVRILEGRRPCGGSGGGMERCIRFEITDECAHYVPSSCIGLGFGSPPVHATPVLSMPSASSDSCPGGPPMMQMQMQMQMQPINRTANHQPYYHAESRMQAFGSTACAAHTCTNAAAATIINTYELEVGETDFAQLRRDQALLVDFGSFADSFISLLGYCDLGQQQEGEEEEEQSGLCDGGSVEQQRTSQPSHTQNQNQNRPTPPRTPYSTELPRYTCRLEELSSAATGRGPLQARFSIVESNQFRELTHLSLNLYKGTDATIRSYLSSRLHQTMVENTALRCNLKQQINRADDGHAQMQEMTQQMQQMATTYEADKALIESQAKDVLKKETMRLSEESQRMLQEKDDQMQSMATKQQEEVAKLNGRISSLENQVAQLSKDKTSTEDDNAKLRDTVRQQADKIETLSKDLSSAKSQVEQLNEEKTATSKSLHEAQIRIATLEQSKISQEQALDQSNALRKVAEVGATTANDTINTQSKQLQEARERIAELESELTTSQETLSRYQRDRADTKQQVKEQSVELAQKDALVAAKTEEHTATRAKLNEVESNLHRLQIDKQAVESELAEAKEKLQESAKLLLSNQHVITYLNREINNTQLGRVGAGAGVVSSDCNIATAPATATGISGVGASDSGLGPPPLSSYNSTFAAPSPSKRRYMHGSSTGGISSGGAMTPTENGPHSSYYSSSLAGLNSYLPPVSTSTSTSVMAKAPCSGGVCPPSPSPASAPSASLPPAPATCPRPTFRTDINAQIARQEMSKISKTPPR